MPLRKTSRAFWQGLLDARIVSRSRASSEQEASFEAVVEKYRRPLFGFLFRLVHDQTAAEELAQETFLRLYRSRDRFDGADKVGIWLYRMAASLAQESPQVARSESASGQQGTQALERVEAIRRQIMGLPARQRAAVLLHKYQGLDCEQVAEVIGISESETRGLLLRAYVTLREKLGELT